MQSKVTYLLLFFSLWIGCLSCEDVVEIDTPITPPRLTIDALIRVDTSKEATTVTVTASLTSSFFTNNEPAELNSISIRNPDYVPTSPLDANFVSMTEVSPGVYVGSKQTSFFTSGELQLLLDHEGNNYIALTSFAPSTTIVALEQGDNTLFSEDDKEVVVTFLDNKNEDNFYLVDLDFGEYLVTEDAFYQGKPFTFSYFYDDSVKSGREIRISLLGIDESFYNYMSMLIDQSSPNLGPFQTPAATVRGNIINVTDINNIDSFDNVENSNNFALGYFAICQTHTNTITIE